MASSMTSPQGAYQLYIDGQFVGNASGKTFSVYDPSTEEVLADVVEASAVEVDLAVQAARRAFDTGPWAASTPQSRAQILFKLAAKVRENLPTLAEMETRNTGKPIVEGE